MTKKCLDGSAFEAIRVPIICEYPGLGDGPGQHASVREPVHNPAPPPCFLNSHVRGDSVSKPWMAMMLSGSELSLFLSGGNRRTQW